MLRNDVELDLKTRFLEDRTTQKEIAERIGGSLPYVNRIIRGHEQIVNKTFIVSVQSPPVGDAFEAQADASLPPLFGSLPFIEGRYPGKPGKPPLQCKAPASPPQAATEQIPFIKILDELGYDVELTYRKKQDVSKDIQRLQFSE